MTFILFVSNLLTATDDIDIIIKHYQILMSEDHQISHNIVLSDMPRLFDKAYYRLFRFYKNYVSSQDVDVCTFVPSCSEYAYDVFRHTSKFKALLITGDRLMRCYGLNKQYYSQDKLTGKNIDKFEY